MIYKIFCRTRYQKYILPILTEVSRPRQMHQTHYDVLNLARNCSSKEIRDAYIKLSKEYHPDTNKEDASHIRFVKVQTAYNVLSKPDSRKDYDLGLFHQSTTTRTTHTYHTFNESDLKGTWDDPSLWKNRNKSHDKYYDGQAYYGIKGLRKVSNTLIVVVCVLFAAVGMALQIITIRSLNVDRKSVTFKRDRMIKRSIEAEKVLSRNKSDAITNGNLMQIELLREKFEQNSVYNTSYENKQDS